MSRGRSAPHERTEIIAAPTRRRPIEAALFEPRKKSPGWQITGVVDTRVWLFAKARGAGEQLTARQANAKRPLCEHCSAPIRHAYRIENSAGQRLILGSDCCRIFLGVTGQQAVAQRRREDEQERQQAERIVRERQEALERERLADEAFEQDRDVYSALRARAKQPPGEREGLRSSFLDDLTERIRKDRLIVFSPRQISTARDALERERQQIERARAWAADAVIEDHPEGEKIGGRRCTLVDLRRQDSQYGERVRVIMRDAGGHKWMYRTGVDTAMGRLLTSLNPGDSVELLQATVTGQADDRALTYITRARLMSA